MLFYIIYAEAAARLRTADAGFRQAKLNEFDYNGDILNIIMGAAMITLSPEGYFQRDGQLFFPVGVNYWAASCGVEMWQQFPEEEIQRDLELIGNLGLNTVRFFLRWQDFEPQPGWYDEQMFDRLAEFCRWCQQRGVLMQPSLFVGWMSGGLFYPNWKEGRNFYADVMMRERAALFARKAAAMIAPFAEHCIGIDLGNELTCLPDCRTCEPDDVIGWTRTITDAIRQAYPAALIVSGTDQNTLVADVGWRLGAMPGCDFYSVHGYPVPGWHPVPFDGMTDPYMQSLLPAYTRIARAFGPVMLQEFGTIATFGPNQQDAYLRAMLPAVHKAGANGYLYWCLRDIRAEVFPYTSNGMESNLGLVDEYDRVKPGLEFFLEFAASIQKTPPPRKPAGDLGVYFPRWYYRRGVPENSGQTPEQASRALVTALYLLRRLRLRTSIVRGDLPLPEGLKILVIPGVYLTNAEAQSLLPWVRGGGKVIWTAPDPMNWGPAYIELLGAVVVDHRYGGAVNVRSMGKDWVMQSFPRGNHVEVEPRTAEVVNRDERGLPMTLRNTVGNGRVVAVLAEVEETVARLGGERQIRDAWMAFYGALLAL